MTTNESLITITEQLKKAQVKDVNIKIDYQMGISVDFLDVTILNDHGQLKTSVYHKSAAEPYILPYTSDHPRHIHRNIPYAALLRAARLCSNVEDFIVECIRSDVSLLLNDYPPNFIEQQRNHFFQINDAISVWNEMNEHDFHRLHHKLLHTLTNREKLLVMMTEEPIRRPLVLQPKIWDTSVMYPRYSFDSSNAVQLQQRFYVWWKTYFVNSTSSLNDVRVRLVPQTNPTLEKFFIQKKPSKHILTRLE